MDSKTVKRDPCPCQVCPRCREVDRDRAHPEDGLAWCSRCENEWWAASGPFRDGRHPRSALELFRWNRHDDATARSGVEPEYAW